MKKNRAVQALDGRVVAITGGARGIGLATAEAFLAAGAKVAVGDIDEDALFAAADALPIWTSGLDVTSEESFTAFIDEAEAELGPVDILVNNAGVMPVGPFVDYSEDLCRGVIDLDLLGVIRGCRVVVARMTGRGSGHIVNVASIAGKISAPGLSLYSAAKFGVVGFSEGLAAELAGSNVSVSVVLPSFTDTGLIDGLRDKAMGPPSTPAEVAAAIVAAAVSAKPLTFVPAPLGPISVIAAVVPPRLKRWLMTRPRYARQFLEPDQALRKGYDERIAASTGTRADMSSGGTADGNDGDR